MGRRQRLVRTAAIALLVLLAPLAPSGAQGDDAAEHVQVVRDGCIRIHHVWKRQLEVEATTAGDSAARARALVERVYRPYADLWTSLSGPSPEHFLRADAQRFESSRRDLSRIRPADRDPGARIVALSERLAALTGRPVPCHEWFVAFLPWGNTASSGIVGARRLQSLGLPLRADSADLDLAITDAVLRRIHKASRRGDPDSSHLVAALLEEGAVAYVKALERRATLDERGALGHDERALRWGRVHEREAWDVVRPILHRPAYELLGRAARSDVLRGGGVPIEPLVGFRLVKAYVDRHGEASWRDVFRRPAAEILRESGYDERLAEGAPIFRHTTGEFWLNLHHFLYVLGRARNGEPDARREAVSGAIADEARVLATMDSVDRASWDAAVAAYAERLSRRDLVFDPALAIVASGLIGFDEAQPMPYNGSDQAIAGALARAGPIYKARWWPEHHVANRRWADSMQALVGRHGKPVLDLITRAYALPWSRGGHPVRAVAYANWAGAYSTTGELLVVSSMAPSTQGTHGLEILFHEAMHQWDEAMITAISREANALGVSAPVALSHQLIFYTAGEAVRRAVPGHVPYAHHFGVWPRLGPTLPAILDELWRPYLDGQGQRDAALAAIVRRVMAPRESPPDLR